jgi:hypothetical protein
MTARALLEKLRDRGAQIWSQGKTLELDAPADLLTPDLLARLKAAKGEILELLHSEDDPLESAPALEVRQQIGAVLIDSPRYGEAWVVLSPRLEWQLRAEESERPNPRPVLTAADLALLDGKSPEMVEAILNTLAAFPGARVLQ